MFQESCCLVKRSLAMEPGAQSAPGRSTVGKCKSQQQQQQTNNNKNNNTNANNNNNKLLVDAHAVAAARAASKRFVQKSTNSLPEASFATRIAVTTSPTKLRIS